MEPIKLTIIWEGGNNDLYVKDILSQLWFRPFLAVIHNKLRIIKNHKNIIGYVILRKIHGRNQQE